MTFFLAFLVIQFPFAKFLAVHTQGFVETQEFFDFLELNLTDNFF